MYSTLKELVKYRCVSGREGQVADQIERMVTPYADSIKKDAMGNRIAFKKGARDDAKKLMFCAHMDEIGFMVTYIEDEGFVRFAAIGGINFTAAAFTEVTFENGTKGVLVPESGTKAEKIAFDTCYVDIGAKSKKEAEKKVKIGDCFALNAEVQRLASGRVCGRPIDDRIGCAVLVKAMQKIEKCENDTYFVFSVQEEVGIRGSKTATYGIMPDYGVAVDICGAAIPGDKCCGIELGKGATIKIKDASVMCDGEFVKTVQDIADEHKITWQPEILLAGGTDTASMQMTGAGCRALGISIPTRYAHTAVETIDLKDADSAAALVCAIASTKLD